MKIRKIKERIPQSSGIKKKVERTYDYSHSDYSAMATDPELKRKHYEDLIGNAGVGSMENHHVRVPTYEVAGNEVFYPDKSGPGKYCNAYITFGHDRVSHLFSGYGGKDGGTRCSTIDICAGSAANLKPFGAKKGIESYGPENVVGKIFAADASRIYISQMTDVDANFGLPRGESADSKGGAAIAMKSDHIRIIGRASIKLYAGSGAFQKASVLGEKSAHGGANFSAKTIELIASDVATIEPLVKGTRLLKCLQNVYGHIAKLYQRVLTNGQSILLLRSGLSLHFHPVAMGTVGIPDSILAAQNAMALPGEIASITDNVAHCLTSELDKAQFLGISPDLLPDVAFQGFSPPGEPAENKINSIKGKKYILSSNVFTT